MPQRLLGIGVNEFLASQPVATPTAWRGPSVQGTAVFNGTTTVTAISVTSVGPAQANTQFVGTDNMVVGDIFVSQGGGVPAADGIATISSTTQVILSSAATLTGTFAFTVIPGAQYNSSFNGNETFQGYEPNSTNIVPDSYISIPNTQSIVNAGHYFIPPGQGIANIVAGASGTTVYQYQVGTVGSWNTLGTVAAGATGLIPYISDGINFRFTNTSAAGNTASTVILIQTN